MPGLYFQAQQVDDSELSVVGGGGERERRLTGLSSKCLGGGLKS